MMQSQSKQHGGLWVTSLLLCYILCFDFVLLISPDKIFSDAENRPLAQLPSLSLHSLSDGSLLQESESWLSDQFPFRDAWMSLSFSVNTKLLQRKERNGAYVGKQQYLFLIPSAVDKDVMERKLDAVERFTAEHDDLQHCMAIIPNAAFILSEQLPAHAPVPDQQEQLRALAERVSGVRCVDVTDTLRAHTDETLYYHTDHHWTTAGAYYAFGPIAEAMGLDSASMEYDVYTVSDSFEGTLSSKTGSHAFRDTIQIYLPQTEVTCNVLCSDSGQKLPTLYVEEQLDTKDQYTVFLGGNHPLVDIRTTADTQRRLLLIKDSYANCFVPFLTPFFDEIVMVDPRYCYDSAALLVNQYAITDVLYLYNLDTFQTEQSLADFLEYAE